MTHPTTQRAARKGWPAHKIAERWGITPRTFSRQAKTPSQQFLDAIDGLPDYAEPTTPEQLQRHRERPKLNGDT